VNSERNSNRSNFRRLPSKPPADPHTVFLACAVLTNNSLDLAPSENLFVYYSRASLSRSFPHFHPEQFNALEAGQSILYFYRDGTVKEIVTHAAYFEMHPKNAAVYAFDSDADSLALILRSGVELQLASSEV
jgi:hypothetical protein